MVLLQKYSIFFQRHSRMSYMASNFVYLEVIATYIRQHPKLDSCGQIPVFHQLNEGMQTLPIFFFWCCLFNRK